MRENYGLQIWLAFIGKPVRMSGQANKLIGCFDEILRSHGGVLAERHVVLAPDVEGRNANLASGNAEIVANGANDFVNVSAVRIVLTCANPLDPQAGQQQTITMERVVEVMNRAGLHT